MLRKYTGINLNDKRQDVHLERKHDANLSRYDVAEKLLPYDSKGLKILELGGGIAELTRRMIIKGIDVTFVDLSEKNLEKARTLGVNAFCIDLNEGLNGLPDDFFDGVVILEVIEHIVAAELLLSEISRVLKKGGFLILSTPNFNFFTNRLRIFFGRLSVDEGYHYRFFNSKVLKKRINEAGFEISRTYNTCPAFGYNFIANRIFKKPRKHIKIPVLFSPLFAQTLIIFSEKS